MRTCLCAIVFLMIICPAAIAAEEPAAVIPLYPGGESTLEVSLANEDLLPTLKAVLPMLKGGGIADKLNPDDLEPILRNVRLVEVTQVEIKNNDTDSKIADFYTKNAPAGEWSQVFRNTTQSGGTIGLFIQSGGEKFYAFRIQPTKDNGKAIRKVTTVRLEGKIDFAKALATAAKLML